MIITSQRMKTLTLIAKAMTTTMKIPTPPSNETPCFIPVCLYICRILLSPSHMKEKQVSSTIRLDMGEESVCKASWRLCLLGGGESMSLTKVEWQQTFSTLLFRARHLDSGPKSYFRTLERCGIDSVKHYCRYREKWPKSCEELADVVKASEVAPTRLCLLIRNSDHTWVMDLWQLCSRCLHVMKPTLQKDSTSHPSDTADAPSPLE